MAKIVDLSFAWDVIRIIAGGVFLVLGILGCFLPILQGILFLAIAAVLLSPYVPFFRRLKIRIYRRFPTIRSRVQGWKKAMRRRLGRT